MPALARLALHGNPRLAATLPRGAADGRLHELRAYLARLHGAQQASPPPASPHCPLRCLCGFRTTIIDSPPPPPSPY